MRGSEWIELAGDVLPRRWLRVIGPLILAVLLRTGTASDVFLWFVQDKAAAIQEDVVEPMLEPLLEQTPANRKPSPDGPRRWALTVYSTGSAGP